MKAPQSSQVQSPTAQLFSCSTVPLGQGGMEEWHGSECVALWVSGRGGRLGHDAPRDIGSSMLLLTVAQLPLFALFISLNRPRPVNGTRRTMTMITTPTMMMRVRMRTEKLMPMRTWGPRGSRIGMGLQVVA